MYTKTRMVQIMYYYYARNLSQTMLYRHLRNNSATTHWNDCCNASRSVFRIGEHPGVHKLLRANYQTSGYSASDSVVHRSPPTLRAQRSVN